MMRRLVAIGAAIGALLVAPHADAQGKGKDFGDKGSFIFSADRLVPLFSFTRLSQDSPPDGAGTIQTVTTTHTGISILWGSTNNANTSFFTVPRVGFDYAFAPNWTVGGDAIVFFTLGGSTDTENKPTNGASTTVSVSGPSTVLFGIAPRAGYIFELNSLFSLWLRAGASFYTQTAKASAGNNSSSSTTNQFALDLEPEFVITPVQHFAFTAGLTADLPLTGKHWAETTLNNVTVSTASASSSLMFIGVTGGLLGWF